MRIRKPARLGAVMLTAAVAGLLASGAAHAVSGPPEHGCTARHVCFWSGVDGTGAHRHYPADEQACQDLGRIRAVSAGNNTNMMIVLVRGTCADPLGDVPGGVLFPFEFTNLEVPLNEPIVPAAGHTPQGYSQQYHYNSYGHDPYAAEAVGPPS